MAPLDIVHIFWNLKCKNAILFKTVFDINLGCRTLLSYHSASTVQHKHSGPPSSHGRGHNVIMVCYTIFKSSTAHFCFQCRLLVSVFFSL